MKRKYSEMFFSNKKNPPPSYSVAEHVRKKPKPNIQRSEEIEERLQKRRQKETVLIKEANRTNKIIRRALLSSDSNGEQKELDIKTAIEAIRIASDLGNLQLFMKRTNYFVFDWCLQHENLDLLNALKQHLRPEYHFLMIEHDDFKPLKCYIRDTLNLSYADYDKVAGKKNAMLLRLVSIHQTEVSRIIYSELNSATDSKLTDAKTLSKLTWYVDNLIPGIVIPSEQSDSTESSHDERVVHFKLTV